MALERDIERLDDYLANRLNEQDKMEFEGKLKGDTELQQEFQIQKGLIEGIRQARIVELKSMLNNIPISPVNPGQTTLATKIISSVIITGLVTTAIYFYFKTDDAQPPVVQQEPVTEAIVTEPQPESVAPIPENTGESKPETKTETQTDSKTVESSASPPVAVQPKLEVYDPTTEAEKEQAAKESEQLAIISKAFVTSSIEVEIDNGSRKNNFHYLFKENKLVLYGAFEKNLYEILEFIGEEKRTVFLFYKSNYYLLDLEKTSPTQLVPIRNQQLLKKLKEYRGN